ncbi:serine threonine- kinase Nek1-like isoform X2 [Labeo rohita]|uniref:non-specific serine/threonine protein kinase n=1 Tax=Labeo rohita TaxID=84645 RepID=A0A498LUH3_LABRO|nr:serine threonine- kinase Nek1-like isoform X2 [Labeo rohita]
MSVLLLHEYHKLSEASDDSDSSDKSIEQPPSFHEELKKHGYTIKEEVGQGASGIVFLVNNEEKDQFVVKQLNSRDILDWFVQICLALQYIHENNVLHRDIRPQNVFLTEEGYINLGDFGCSKILERGDTYAESVVGASLYLSPEVYQKKYNSKSDIWSLGWLLHDLCMLDVWVMEIHQSAVILLLVLAASFTAYGQRPPSHIEHHYQNFLNQHLGPHLHEYHKLSEASDDSDSSDKSIEQPPSFHDVTWSGGPRTFQISSGIRSGSCTEAHSSQEIDFCSKGDQCFFIINPEKGTKVVEEKSKKRLPVNPRVFTLISDLSDYEW